MRRMIYGIGIVLACAVLAVLVWAARPLVRAADSGVAPPVGTDAALAGMLATLAGGTGIDALMVVTAEGVLVASGDNVALSNVASVRKSVIAVLYGIAVERGLVHLDATLADLAIDEPATPLTAAEKTATVLDLLAARSGIYLPSGAETAEMRAGRPARGTYQPGAHFYYNNRDFNVLGAIFERETGQTIGQALATWVGGPAGFADFRSDHVTYEGFADSGFPTWRIYLSNRDLARLGQVLLGGGRWQGQQLVPEAWVARMLAPVPNPNEGFDYGLLWWFDEARGAAFANGAGGQYLILDRDRRFAIAIKNHTGNSPLGYVWRAITQADVSRDTALAIYDAVANASRSEVTRSGPRPPAPLR